MAKRARQAGLKHKSSAVVAGALFIEGAVGIYIIVAARRQSQWSGHASPYQFSIGTLFPPSTTMTSKGSLRESSFRPSSSKTVKIEGAVSFSVSSCEKP